MTCIDTQYKDVLTDEQIEWKPIETAPKDGTKILLSDLEDVFFGSWIESLLRGFEWWSGEKCGTVWPTHWMPLPELPREG